ncbi:hypothetical protein GOP47_0018902 [Adiantum capillus-veneris]|uniref:Uncharacterized protein n=1 Tax=Adiantum capillus-veneris TaxID=13818 RepID=A0A9D4Z8K9_ADICA|nr:hypothetical protein GOP47_0018902 [Adiantum capillus-veneris]
MGEASEAVLKHEQLFNYLHQLLIQIEEQTGKPDLELREKLEALSREITRSPSSAAAQLGDIEIAQELDKLSAKLDFVEERIAPAVVDPEVQNLLSATAELWIPTITASSQDRVSIAAASSNINSSDRSS